ncbi:MAG: hypothetical protein Kow0075_06590 [Salibacteraceae bacterium]
MSKKLFPGLCICFLWLSISVQCQDISTSDASTSKKSDQNAGGDSPSFWERTFFGGSVGAQFGTITYIGLAPLVGYRVTERWSVGTRITYNYYRVNTGSYIFKDYIYGGSVFTRYTLWKELFAHVEFEELNGQWKYAGERFFIPSLFAGLGLTMPFGPSGGIQLMGLYNLLQSPYSPYRNPLLNVGVVFGL